MEVPTPGSSPDPELLDDVTGLLTVLIFHRLGNCLRSPVSQACRLSRVGGPLPILPIPWKAAQQLVFYNRCFNWIVFTSVRFWRIIYTAEQHKTGNKAGGRNKQKEDPMSRRQSQAGGNRGQSNNLNFSLDAKLKFLSPGNSVTCSPLPGSLASFSKQWEGPLVVKTGQLLCKMCRRNESWNQKRGWFFWALP